MKTKWLNKISKYLYLYTIGLMVLIYFSHATDWTLYTPPPCSMGNHYDSINWIGPKEMILCANDIGLSCSGCCYKIIYYDKIDTCLSIIKNLQTLKTDTISYKENILDIAGIFYEAGCNCNKCTSSNYIINKFYDKYYQINYYYEDSLLYYRTNPILYPHQYMFCTFTAADCYDNNNIQCSPLINRCCYSVYSANYDTTNVFSHGNLQYTSSIAYTDPCPEGCNTFCNQVLFSSIPIDNDTCKAPCNSLKVTYYSHICQQCITVHLCVHCYFSYPRMDINITGYENICASNLYDAMRAEIRDSIKKDSSLFCGYHNCKNGVPLTINLKEPLCTKVYWDGIYLYNISCSDPNSDDDWCFSTYSKCYNYETLRMVVIDVDPPHTNGNTPSCPDTVITYGWGDPLYNTASKTPWTTPCFRVQCK